MGQKQGWMSLLGALLLLAACGAAIEPELEPEVEEIPPTETIEVIELGGEAETEAVEEEEVVDDDPEENSAEPTPTSAPLVRPTQVAATAVPGGTPEAGPASGDSVSTSSIPNEILNSVFDDFRAKAGGEPSYRITLAAPVTWNDGALGCPEPGAIYTQATVDGYHIIIEVGDQVYDYRINGRGAFKLCLGSDAPPVGGTPSS